MRITEESLTGMGAVLCDDWWELKERGWRFAFQQDSGVWWFKVETGVKHAVVDLEECFGIIASDCYGQGSDQFKDNLNDLLNSTLTTRTMRRDR